MAYAPTDWVDNATPVDAAHLDNIEQGIVALDTGKVDRDATVTAAARLVASKLVAGDANPAFRVLGDGTMLWGSGGAAIQDVQLSRRANDGQMRLTGTPSLYVEHGFVAGQGITSFAGTAQQVDIGFVLAQPGFNFGFPSDTNLYRAGVNQLKTDGDLSAVGLLRASRGGGVDEVVVGTSGIGFGGDTTLARAGVNSLRTPGNFTAALDLLARGAAATQSWIGDAGGGKAGIVLGSAQDVKLYRNGVGVLRTDGTLDANALTINGVPVSAGGATDITGKVDKDSVVVAATRIIASKLLAGDAQPAFFLGGDGKIQWGTGGAAALDTNLYRTAPGQLKTDGTLRVSQGISANYGSSGQIHLDSTGRLYFGNALDTFLYRNSAGVLKTDGRFIAADAAYAYLANPAAVGGYAFASFIGAEGSARFIIVAADGRLQWGPGGAAAQDANLYRSGAGILKTDGQFYTGSYLSVANGAAGQVSLGAVGAGAAAGASFGSAGDANIYRSAAGVIGLSMGALGNRDLVYGAADSGGVGFRTVRVAN
jgi:hypothetical protein